MKTDFKQEIFDFVVRFLLKQNQKSQNEYMIYKYHLNDGKKCAMGCLIPDKDYHPDMELLPKFVNRYFIDSGYSREEMHLIQDLRTVHDHEDVCRWRKEFKKVADTYNLNCSCLLAVQ